MFLPSATSSQIEIMLHLGFESEQIPFGDDNQKQGWNKQQNKTGTSNGKNNGGLGGARYPTHAR
jgi:hypothetical protein